MGFCLTGQLSGSDHRLISYLQVTRMTQYYTLDLLYAGREKNLDSHTYKRLEVVTAMQSGEISQFAFMSSTASFL